LRSHGLHLMSSPPPLNPFTACTLLASRDVRSVPEHIHRSTRMVQLVHRPCSLVGGPVCAHARFIESPHPRRHARARWSCEVRAMARRGARVRCAPRTAVCARARADGTGLLPSGNFGDFSMVHQPLETCAPPHIEPDRLCFPRARAHTHQPKGVDHAVAVSETECCPSLYAHRLFYSLGMHTEEPNLYFGPPHVSPIVRIPYEVRIPYAAMRSRRLTPCPPSRTASSQLSFCPCPSSCASLPHVPLLSRAL
jgi:hypothetical protein